MLNHKNDNLIIKASTGIGKTEGALVWIGNNKGFFTLPLRVSINSIYDRVVEKIKYEKKKTALLHSDSASEYIKRDSNSELDKNYLDTTKQLSMPLTICTLDQLIGFIFKYEGFELKLATLSYSKIVIDEIQMYSSEMVAYLILALREIVEMGGKFAIVTATFPPIFEFFMNKVRLLEEKTYIKPDKPFLKEQNNKVMLRHKIKIIEENITAEKIYMGFKNQKVLVIVNTVNQAQKLYRELSEYKDLAGKLFMFHSRYTKEDRAKKEEHIFNCGKLENSFKGIWITTQVVEASLDIDFDVLYTELSEVSGLFQRMGRVYRNRILNSEQVNVNIFIGKGALRPSGISNENSVVDIDIFNRSREVIKKYNEVKLDEEEKMNIVDEVYSLENMKDTKYFSKINETIDIMMDIEPYNISKSQAKLREILSENIIPLSVYEENKEELLTLKKELEEERNISNKIKIRDNIMNKTVNISEKIFSKIENKDIINVIEISKYQKIYVVDCEYSYEEGFMRNKKKDSDFNNFI